MTEITAEKLALILSDPAKKKLNPELQEEINFEANGNIKFANLKIKGTLKNWPFERFRNKIISFSNSTFEEALSIDNMGVIDKLCFDRCTFLGNITPRQNTSGKCKIDFNDSCKINLIKLDADIDVSIDISNCDIQNILVEHSSTTGIINLFGTNHIENIEIDSSKFLFHCNNDKNKIYRLKVNAAKSLDLTGCEISQSQITTKIILGNITKLKISRTLIYGEIVFPFEHWLSKKILIEAESQIDRISGFFNDISINNSILGNLEICDGNDRQKCSILNGSTIEQILVKENSSNVSLHFGDIQEEITQQIKINTLKITKSTNINIKAYYSEISSLVFSDVRQSENHHLEFYNTSFGELVFDQMMNKGNIRFVNCNCKEDLISRFSKRKISISLDQSFRMTNSSLGNIEFLNSNFNHFLNFEIRGCNLSDAYISSSSFPDKITLPNGKRKNHYARQGYFQLKKVFESQGDNLTAFRYYSKEMNSYLSELWEEWKTNPIICLKTYSKWEIIQLALNKFTSDFGSNWLQGIGVTLFYGLIFHLLFFHTLDSPYNVSFCDINWDVTKEAVGHYFKFLSPFRSFSNENPLGTPTWSTSIADFIGRIFITYGAYETVQAFRRHGRK